MGPLFERLPSLYQFSSLNRLLQGVKEGIADRLIHSSGSNRSPDSSVYRRQSDIFLPRDEDVMSKRGKVV